MFRNFEILKWDNIKDSFDKIKPIFYFKPDMKLLIHIRNNNEKIRVDINSDQYNNKTLTAKIDKLNEHASIPNISDINQIYVAILDTEFTKMPEQNGTFSINTSPIHKFKSYQPEVVKEEPEVVEEEPEVVEEEPEVVEAPQGEEEPEVVEEAPQGEEETPASKKKKEHYKKIRENYKKLLENYDEDASGQTCGLFKNTLLHIKNNTQGFIFISVIVCFILYLLLLVAKEMDPLYQEKRNRYYMYIVLFVIILSIIYSYLSKKS